MMLIGILAISHAFFWMFLVCGLLAAAVTPGRRTKEERAWVSCSCGEAMMPSARFCGSCGRVVELGRKCWSIQTAIESAQAEEIKRLREAADRVINAFRRERRAMPLDDDFRELRYDTEHQIFLLSRALAATSKEGAGDADR